MSDYDMLLLRVEHQDAKIERLRAALERIDYYYNLNDCDQMSEHEAIEIDVKAMRDVHRALANGQEGK